MKKPFEISITQREVIDFSLESIFNNRQVFIEMETGMGKTLTCGQILSEVVGSEKIKILYVCPPNLIYQVDKVLKVEYPGLDIDYKSFEWFKNLAFVRSQVNLAKQYDIVVVDEAHKIKNYSSSILNQGEHDLNYFHEQKKFMGKKFPYVLVSIGVLAFISQIKYKIFMTGTAMPLGAMDIFNYLWQGKHTKLISNKHSRQESYFEFCDMYCNKKATPNGVSYRGFKKKNESLLLKNLALAGYIRRDHADEKTEHLRIPTPIYRKIFLPDKERNFVEEEKIIEILQKHYNINEENFLDILKTTPQFAQMMALRRAVGISKVKAVLKHEKKVGKKAIYFFQFKEAAQIFYNEIRKKHKNCFFITGELSVKKSGPLVEQANQLDEAIIVATMAKAGTGFDCNKFPNIAFVELDMNLILVAQGHGRIMRKGITHTPGVFFFLNEGGVDKMIINNLLDKNFKPLQKAVT